MGAAKIRSGWVHNVWGVDDADAPVAGEYELEVELRQGSRSVVIEIAQCLSRRCGLAPQMQSKYERGAALTGAFAHATTRAAQATALVGV